MPDPNVTLTAIQSHANALDGAIRRHVANAGRCKVFGAAGVMGVVLLASGKAQMGALPWVAGVVVLLALADACQVVMARICTDAYNGFMRKLPHSGSGGGNAMKAEECFVLPAPEPGWREAGRVLGALGSFSVLPFYGALLALVVAFYVQGVGSGGCCEDGKPARLLTSSATKGCSAGGGCGTSGGCGSGGCGAGAGKGCGCGSGAAAKTTQSANTGSRSAAAKPLQSPIKTAQPVNGAFPSSRVTSQPANVRPPAANAPGGRVPPEAPGGRVPPSAVPPSSLPTLPVRPSGALPGTALPGGAPTLTPPRPAGLPQIPASPPPASPNVPVPGAPGQ